jgi:hypothetical protein
MEYLLTEIEKSLEADLPLVAVLAALTIPDICGGAENPGMANGERYRQWFETYAASQIKLLSSYDCWRVRCWHSHEGTARHEQGDASDAVKGQRFDRVAYFSPSATDREDHFIFVGADGVTLQLNARLLCEQMVAGARFWLRLTANNPTVQVNLERMIQPLKSGDWPIAAATRLG